MMLTGIPQTRDKVLAVPAAVSQKINDCPASAAKVTAIRTGRAKGLGLRRIATDLHVGVGTVLRVLGANTLS